MGHRDHYATLGLPRGAELSLIQATYWRLARQCNAALTSDPEAPRLLRDLNEAYEVLSTPQLRRQFDELLARTGVATEASPRPRWRLLGRPRRPLGEGKETLQAEKAGRDPEPLAPPKTEHLETSRAPEAIGVPPEPGGAGEQSQDALEASGPPKNGAAATSPVRWEMPPLQAFVASTGIAVLGGMALAAGAAPALTLVLGGTALFFCLLPWRFGRLPERLAPRAEDPHPPDDGQRAAALRDSTDPGELQPSASHPPTDP
jgi:hypothetical protein